MNKSSWVVMVGWAGTWIPLMVCQSEAVADGVTQGCQKGGRIDILLRDTLMDIAGGGKTLTGSLSKTYGIHAPLEYRVYRALNAEALVDAEAGQVTLLAKTLIRAMDIEGKKL